MPIKNLPGVEDLPQRSATHVKSRWSDLEREVREGGCVAITRHGTVEVVLMDAAMYREMVALADVMRKDRR